jgi:hypothetical protein
MRTQNHTQKTILCGSVVLCHTKEIIEPDNSYLEMSVFSLQPIIDNFFLVCVRGHVKRLKKLRKFVFVFVCVCPN